MHSKEIQEEHVTLALVPVVSAKKGLAEQGREIGIIGDMVITTTFRVIGRKLE